MPGDSLNYVKNPLVSAMVFFFFVFLLETALAEVITVQGQLADAQGQSWSGLVTIEFSIHDNPTNGSKLWAEAQEVEVLEGLFTASLGALIELDEALFITPTFWLGIDVDGTGEQAQRFRLSSSALTIRADTVESLSPGSVEGSQLEISALTPDKLTACEIGDLIVMGADGWACQSPGEK